MGRGKNRRARDTRPSKRYVDDYYYSDYSSGEGDFVSYADTFSVEETLIPKPKVLPRNSGGGVGCFFLLPPLHKGWRFVRSKFSSDYAKRYKKEKKCQKERAAARRLLTKLPQKIENEEQILADANNDITNSVKVIAKMKEKLLILRENGGTMKQVRVRGAEAIAQIAQSQKALERARAQHKRSTRILKTYQQEKEACASILREDAGLTPEYTEDLDTIRQAQEDNGDQLGDHYGVLTELTAARISNDQTRDGLLREFDEMYNEVEEASSEEDRTFEIGTDILNDIFGNTEPEEPVLSLDEISRLSTVESVFPDTPTHFGKEERSLYTITT